MLTENSKELLLNHLRKEIGKNSRVPQNLDHSITNAKMSWAYQPELADVAGYGSGPTRQIIAESDVEFYHPNVHTSMHLYAPLLNPNQGLYIYQLYPGDSKRAPIDILGTLEPLPEKKYHDRLHLKLIQPEDFKRIQPKLDMLTSTEKIDGASCYLSSNTQGIKVFSPRISKVTGKNIEYTWKLPQIANEQPSSSFVTMGELAYERRTLLPLPSFMKRISAAETGGILNSNAIVPRNRTPRVHLYRVDKFNGIDTHDLNFFENRNYQYKIASFSNYLSVVPLRSLNFTKAFSLEGNVIVPPDSSVNGAYKLKWLGDETDMTITEVNFSLSEKGNIQGTVTARYQDKEYNFGPGQCGSFDTCMTIMDNSDNYIGRVIKVVSRRGGIARAAKIIDIHMDK